MPKKTEHAGIELETYVNTLVDRGSVSGSVSEDEIQVVLKDVDVDDAQLSSIYTSLRDRGIEVTSQVDGDDDLPMDVDDVADADDEDALGVDDLDDDLDDESIEDHDIKVAKIADVRDGLGDAQEEVEGTHLALAFARTRNRCFDRHAHRGPRAHVPQGDR